MREFARRDFTKHEIGGPTLSKVGRKKAQPLSPITDDSIIAMAAF
jgi:hypothetical protein